MGSARDGAVGSEDHSPGFTQMQPEATSIRLFTVNPLLSRPFAAMPALHVLHSVVFIEFIC